MTNPQSSITDAINSGLLQLIWNIAQLLLIPFLIFIILIVLFGIVTYHHRLERPTRRSSDVEVAFYVFINSIYWFLDVIFGKRNYGGTWLDDQQILAKLRNMSPEKFEIFIGQMFARMGYHGEVVGGSSDGGIDIELTKNGRRSVVQCKKFITRNVTPEDVRGFYGAMGDARADGGFFITTNIFTLAARNWAEDKMDLIDGTRLVQLVRETNTFDLFSTEPVAIREKKFEICPRCGSRLVVRTNKKDGTQFLGCSTYPKCRYTLAI